MPDEARYQQIGLPGLLRMARTAYGNSVRAAFAEAGFDDVPRNGAYVLARVHDGRSSLAELTRQLGISKQAVSQLIDTMVMRGYLQRSPDVNDRRRMTLTLTPRGEGAAHVAWQAANAVDEELASHLSPDGVTALHDGLAALCQIAQQTQSGRGSSAEMA